LSRSRRNPCRCDKRENALDPLDHWASLADLVDSRAHLALWSATKPGAFRTASRKNQLRREADLMGLVPRATNGPSGVVVGFASTAVFEKEVTVMGQYVM
jgi:hypothetical protein